VYHRLSGCTPPPSWGTGSPADEAAATLVRIGAPAVPYLLPRVKVEDEAARALVIETLGRIGGDKVFPALVAGLKDSSGRVRESAAEALYSRNDSPSTDALIAGLDDENAGVRWYAAKAIIEHPTGKAVQPLVRLLKRESGVDQAVFIGFLGRIPTAGTAAVALGTIGSPAWDSIMELYSDPDPFLHKLATTALVFCADRRAIPLLLPLTGSSDVDTRRRAASALGRWDDPRSIRALAKMLNDGGEAAGNAATSLARIGGPAALDALFQAFHSSDANLRYVVQSSFLDIQDRRAIPALLEVLRSDDKLAVRSALFRLGTWRETRALPTLLKMATDADMETRRAAIGLLGYYKDSRVVPVLLKALADPHEWVRAQAAGALMGRDDPRIEPAIKTLLKDPSAEVRRSAEYALKALRSKPPSGAGL
jgi:HEAT repeat protein